MWPHAASAGKATQGLLSWVQTFRDERKHAWPPCLRERHRVSGPPRFSGLGAPSFGKGQPVLLGSTRVDVLPVCGVLHEGNVVIGGQGEMRDAAHEASPVVPVGVQSDFLHSTCREPEAEWVRHREPCLLSIPECLLTKVSLEQLSASPLL